jgi:hypothetical protein
MRTAWKGPYEGEGQEGIGRPTGMRTRAGGTAQDLYGQAADSARESASTLGSRLRRAIEPHTMHRP